jgi:hypothetical protein
VAGEVGDEPAAVVAELLVDTRARVIGILCLAGERGAPAERMHRMRRAVRRDVGLPAGEPVYVVATVERQVSEHVVERAVLEHQHDYVLDLLKILHARVNAHRCHACRGRRWLDGK